MKNAKYVYCGYGYAGRIGLWRMMTECAIPARNILAYTYDSEENRSLLDLLEQSGIPYHLHHITGEGARDEVRAFGADLLVSVYYRHRVPNSVLSLVRRGGINLHPSLLPEYRGTFSGPWAIINREEETGISWHVMTEAFDEGALLLQKRFPLVAGEDGYTLYQKLVATGTHWIGDAITHALDEGFVPQAQKGKGSYYPRELPCGGMIDPSWPRQRVDAFIRALRFPGKPCAHLTLDGMEFEVESIEQYDLILEQVLAADEDGVKP